MLRALVVVCTICIVLGACTQKMVCPAYQSAFIYDKDELRKKFSYFNEDSTPKIYTASKNKYLIAEPTTLKKKTREMRTVEARAIQPIVPDSLTEGYKKDDLDDSDFSLAEVEFDSTMLAANEPAPVDSVEQDSIYVISKDREVRMLRYNFPDSMKYDPVEEKYVPEKPYYYVEEVGFNTEQNNYMWYLREWLVLPDVKLAQNQNRAEESSSVGASGKKKKGGFFKNLFKKKDKKKKKDQLVEEEEREAPEEETIDFKDLDSSDSTSISTTAQTAQDAAPLPTETGKKKKGFSLFKKKKTKTKDAKKDPAKKEDDDEGF